MRAGRPLSRLGPGSPCLRFSLIPFQPTPGEGTVVDLPPPPPRLTSPPSPHSSQQAPAPHRQDSPGLFQTARGLLPAAAAGRALPHPFSVAHGGKIRAFPADALAELQASTCRHRYRRHRR
ncbi:unnamed protein product [Gadus morhua 'NCC']